MRLNFPGSDDFEPVLKEISDIALSSGLRKLEKRGYHLSTIKIDQKLARQFIRDCHRGYDQAQSMIGKQIISYLADVQTKQGDLKSARRIKDQKTCLQLEREIGCLESRTLVLRRLIDTIAFTMFSERVWIARRLEFLNYIRKVDVSTLEVCLKEAGWRNSKDRQVFALASDLSTFIDVGDLLVVDFRIKGSEKWRIEELKSGKVNTILQGIISEYGEDVPDEAIEGLKETNPKASAQLARMIRQIRRVKNTERIKVSNETVDNALNLKVSLSENETPIQCWNDQLAKVLEDAGRDGLALRIIDGCLFVLAVRGSPAKARHLLYHIITDKHECGFSNQDHKKLAIEISEIRSINHLYDFTALNLNARGATPIFLYPLAPDLIRDLLFERISVAIHLSLDGLTRLGNKMQIPLRLASRKETAELTQAMPEKYMALFSKKCLMMTYPSGKELCLGGGFLSRMFVDLHGPKKVLDLFYRNSVTSR